MENINSYSVYEFNFFGENQRVINIDNEYFFIDYLDDLTYKVIKKVKYSTKYKLIRAFWVVQRDDKIILFHEYSLAQEYLNNLDLKKEIDLIEEITDLLTDLTFEELQQLKLIVVNKTFNVSKSLIEINKQKKKFENIEKCKVEITEYFKNNSSENFMLKNMLYDLKINNKTFYNYNLDEFIKQFLEKK